MSEIAFDNSYARLAGDFFARVNPAEVPEPALVQVNRELALELGLDPRWLSSAEGLSMLAGNALPKGADPIAMAYAGHQFGGWSPQLGDGRAILIGELVGKDGIRRDIQLKGSGRTPFSRQGDGKSPIGPVIREYIVSEAMAALGIPTTRALAAVTTGETVHRERPSPGGVLTRVAQSHVRVGTFQFFYGREQIDQLKMLADYVIDRHYPDARQAENPYADLIERVAKRQATLIASWMKVGFIHGVMNTDNTQIAGETIDFGPCAFMEAFDPETVLSSIDRRGRYAWGKQPGIGQWNLTRLAESLLPILADEEEAAVEVAENALEVFGPAFNLKLIAGFRAKLGLPPLEEPDQAGSDDFVSSTFVRMKEQKTDFTLFFRHLTLVAAGREADSFLALFESRAAGLEWMNEWRQAAKTSGNLPQERVDAMRQANPIFIPRNHRVEEAIRAGVQADYRPFRRLNEILARPFEEQPEHAEFEHPATDDELIQQTFCGT